jgi:cell division topological specificity factor
VFGLFRRRKSKDDLKQRLKLVLSYDRARLSPGKMEQLKRELLAVVQKYFPSDGEDLNVRFEQHADRMVLIADLPRQQPR